MKGESFFSGWTLPATTPLTALAVGRDYLLEIEVTDGSTPPVRARRTFLYQGETVILFDAP